jgi:hypothetical protein
MSQLGIFFNKTSGSLAGGHLGGSGVEAPFPEVVETHQLLLQGLGQAHRLRLQLGAAHKLGQQVRHGQVEVGQVSLVLLQAQQVVLQVKYTVRLHILPTVPCVNLELLVFSPFHFAMLKTE